MSETLRHAGYVLRENPVTAAAFALFTFLVLCAVLGPGLVPYDPLASDTARALSPPSAAHWFGTDQLGRDIFSRIVVATRLGSRDRRNGGRTGLCGRHAVGPRSWLFRRLD